MRHPEVDAVIVGTGYAGGVLSAELAKAGLRVVALERGPDRRRWARTGAHDELRYRVRDDLMQDPALETWTFRHHSRETALPMRRLGAFKPGTGVGGSSAHFGGQTFRMLPHQFAPSTYVVSRYGD